MNYSRKQLYALGEPFGESATRLKPGGRVYGGGGSSSQPADTTQTTTQELPEWARGYAKDTLSKASALTDISKNPYQVYGADRIAGFQPMQQQAFQGAANMQPSQQVGLGSNIAGMAGLGALGTDYQAGQFSNQFQNPGQYQPGQFSMLEAQGQGLQNYQMGPAERVRSQNFDNPSAQQYMSPYTQNVVDYQKSQALRDFQIAQPMRNAQAVQQGAFGGSRGAIMDAEAQRTLNSQLQGIEATGQQAAFQNAQQQFNADQARRMQAQQSNQQAGLTVGGQNLAANLGVQQLGAGQNMQAQLANQQAYQQAQTAAEQSRQYGAGQGLQAAGLNAQYGQAAQQAGEQSRQYGAGLDMQGLQTGLQAASTLGQLGQTQYGQQMGINQLQSAYGTQQQQQAQRPMDMAYQDFMNQQNYPYKQLGFMSDMIRGLPLGQQSTAQVYQAPPSAIQTVGALGLGAYGVNQLTKAKGGLAGAYAGGGMVAFGNGGDTDVTASPMDDPTEMAKAVSDLSDEQLQDVIQHPSSAAELQAAKLELATRASEKNGLASAYDAMTQKQQQPPQQAPQQMPPQMAQQAPQQPMMQAARGGIMGFKFGGEPEVEGDDWADTAETPEQIAALKEEQLAALDTGGTGNVAERRKWEDRLGGAYTNLENYTPRTMTDAERRADTLKNYQEAEKMIGPDPSQTQLDRIAGLEKSQVSNLEQQKGLAAFAAIPEILKGGNAARGLGGAAGAFGGMYGKAVQADREEKRSLMSMKNNLEQAQYKTKAGLYGDARQLTAEARRDQQAAAAANIAKQKAMGILAKEGVKLNAPIKPAAVKFEPADSKALTNFIEEAYGNTPQKKGESDLAYKRRVEGIGTRNYAQEMKQDKNIRSNTTSAITSTQLQDKGPNVLTSGAEAAESAEINKGVAAFEAMTTSYNKAAQATVKKYMDANGGDAAKAARAYAEDTRVTPKAATGNNPIPAPKVAPKVAPTTGKVMTQADIAATAKASGKTIDEVKAQAKLKGYTIQ
jgi:hypothetical protein